MIIRYISDLHIDFSTKETARTLLPELPDDHNSVLVIAGDVANGFRGNDFVKDLSEKFKYIIYVLGNHEFYGKDATTIVHKIKKSFSDYQNVHILEKEAISIRIDKEICNFFGATLWTDFANDPLAMFDAGRMMNDYSQIKNSANRKYTSKFTPHNSVALHNETLVNLEQFLVFANGAEVPYGYTMKNIVVTHHLPSYACISKQFWNSKLNPAFASNLDKIIENSNVDYWIHGHTHNAIDVMVHKTRILCNPRGYESFPGDFNLDFNAEAYIEF